MLSVLFRPFVTTPLLKLFSTDTTVRPEDTFDGKVIIVNLPVQEFRTIGHVCALTWKWVFQIQVMRRQPHPNNRFVFLYADEAQVFLSPNGQDADYQAVARSARGCTVFLTQQKEGIRRILRSDDATENLCANLQNKLFCQNTGETNNWASALLGERYTNIKTRSISLGRQHGPTMHPQDATGQAGMNRSEHEELRRFLEPARFTILKKGGSANDHHIEAILYCGGKLFQGEGKDAEPLPYRLLNFRQERR